MGINSSWSSAVVTRSTGKAGPEIDLVSLRQARESGAFPFANALQHESNVCTLCTCRRLNVLTSDSQGSIQVQSFVRRSVGQQ